MSMRSKTADGHEGSEAAVGASVPRYEATVVAASDASKQSASARGYIHRHVLNVSVIPATREGMMRVLPIVSLTAGPPTDTREAVSGSDHTGSG